MYMPRTKSTALQGDDVQTAAEPGGEENGQKKEVPSGSTLKRRILRWLIALPIVIMVGYALFQEEGILWLFKWREPKDVNFLDPDLSVATLLAPLTALALAIERVIEVVFDLIEQSLETMGKLVGQAEDSLDWVNKEYSDASEQLKTTVNANKEKWVGNDKAVQQAKDQLAQAESRLEKAGKLLESIPKDPIYRSTKRAISITGGLFLGYLVAIFADQGVFMYFGVGAPRIVELVLAGFIIGAGSGPVHSLVGILQGIKDSLASFGNRDIQALKDEIEKLKAQ
jgi:hypothetical protein